MFSSVHIVGLGGTGANIIQAMIASEKLTDHLKKEDYEIACLAIDIADGDLTNLNDTYKKTIEKLQAEGTPIDKLWVRTLNIKFNTPDSLWEFMEKYDKYVAKEGIQIQNYQPWIKSSTAIPPLAGGVGRQRALSKAVYNLNYFHYSELNSIISVFKDRVLTSKHQPIVVIVFGLGGGTGSGMVLDFARHLRAKLGSAIPIIGLTILPSEADDLLARGPAPYNSLMEMNLLFNNGLNEKIVDKYGTPYRNPFNSLFFLPLEPIYNNRNNLVAAQRELDNTVIEVLNLFTNFDLADLLSRAGTNNDFASNWVHALAYLKIKYPVEDYVNYLQNYLQLAEDTGELITAKKEALDEINNILTNRYNEYTELYRRHLTTTGTYNPDTFNGNVEDTIHRGGKFDAELRKQMQGLRDFTEYYDAKWDKTLQAMQFPENSIEHHLMQQIRATREKIRCIDKNYEDYERNHQQTASDIEGSLTASKFLTSTQIRQIRSYLNLAALIAAAIKTVKTHLRAKALSDENAVLYAKDKGKQGNRATHASETELLPLYKTIGLILSRTETEIKMTENIIPGLKTIKGNMEARINEEAAEEESLKRQINQKEIEEKRLKTETARIRFDISGKKNMLEKNAKRLRGDIINLKASLDDHEKKTRTQKDELEKVAETQKSLDVTSDYWRKLNTVYTKTIELNQTLSQITTASGYYERVAELSDAEQTKIMDKILSEEEDRLKGEGILKEIIDRDRLRGILRSYVRIFSVPNYTGLSDSYRTDLIWTTVSIPQTLWDQQLQGMLSNTLNVFSSVEASRSISIRQIDQVDPWTITFLVILAKANIRDIEKFPSMKSDADTVRRGERALFRSFLIEQGIHDLGEYQRQIEGESKGGAQLRIPTS